MGIAIIIAVTLIIILGIIGSVLSQGNLKPIIDAYTKRNAKGSISENELKELKENLSDLTKEVKQLREEFSHNNERIKLLEQNYNFAENLLEDKNNQDNKYFPVN